MTAIGYLKKGLVKDYLSKGSKVRLTRKEDTEEIRITEYFYQDYVESSFSLGLNLVKDKINQQEYIEIFWVNLPKNKRRKGLFKSMITDLQKHFEEIRIIWVESYGMHCWLDRNNFIEVVIDGNKIYRWRKKDMEISGVDLNELFKEKVLVYKEYKVLKGNVLQTEEFNQLADAVGIDKKTDSLIIFSRDENNLIMSNSENIDIFNKELTGYVVGIFDNIDSFEEDKVVVGKTNYYHLKPLLSKLDNYRKMDFKETDTVGKVSAFNNKG